MNSVTASVHLHIYIKNGVVVVVVSPYADVVVCNYLELMWKYCCRAPCRESAGAFRLRISSVIYDVKVLLSYILIRTVSVHSQFCTFFFRYVKLFLFAPPPPGRRRSLRQEKGGGTVAGHPNPGSHRPRHKAPLPLPENSLQRGHPRPLLPLLF